MAEGLTYSVVMATRNRPEAVALSIPLLLAQTRRPEKIVIVDSSDDGGPIEAIATAARDTGPVEIRYLHSGPGLTAQRNIGVGLCTSDIILFPDDDSLLYRDTAEIMMAAYDADPDRRIAAVCAVPVNQPPGESAAGLGTYAAETVGPVRHRLRVLRQRIKDLTEALNPFLIVGNRLNAPRIALLGPELADRVAPVPYMTGFRMSFRRDVIAAVGFDETLSRYAWFEDIDASWGAMRHGAVVVAKGAQIYHHRAASARADGHRMGVWAILNRGYIVMKHVHANPDVFPDPGQLAQSLKRYCRGRVLAYRVLARNSFERDRARGAAQALKGLSDLTSAPQGSLADTYRRLEAG